MKRVDEKFIRRHPDRSSPFETAMVFILSNKSLTTFYAFPKESMDQH